MRRVVEAAMVLLEHADGAAVELDDHRGHMIYVCATGSLSQFAGLELTLDGSLSGLAVRSGSVLRCEDSETDPRVDREACRRVGARSMICVPLRRKEDTVGVLKVSSREPDVFSDNDVVALRALSDFVAAAVGAATDLVETSDALLGARAIPASPAADESMAAFVAHILRPGIADDVAVRSRVEGVLAHRRYSTVFQPIVDIETMEVVGVEALTRFHAEPRQGPDKWFSDAHDVGLGIDLETATAAAALALLDRIPPHLYVAVNASPQALLKDCLAGLCADVAADRVVVELTEHAEVDSYPELLAHLHRLRDRGVRLAIDDTGAGISSLAHIVKLRPDLIKLDRALTSGIDDDPVRRALARALLEFGGEIDAHIVAEGVETAAELATLRRLGVRVAQGYYLARPAPLTQLPATLDAAIEARAPADLVAGHD